MNGGRIGGRRTQQLPPQGGYGGRGPPPMGMNMHDPMGNPMMGRDPNRPGGGAYPPQVPMGQQPMPPPPQQWQQQNVQYVDQFGNPIPQGQPAGYPGYVSNPNVPQQGLRHQQPPHPGGMMPPPQQQQHQAPMQQPVMYGQMPPQQQQQQHMMPVFQQQQQYIVQQPGQRYALFSCDEFLGAED
jgi:hypothetical protein